MFSTLESKKYSSNKLNEWTDAIATKVIDRMREIAPYFKYIVNVCFVEKTGAGIFSETIAYWDAKTDGFVVLKYENESLICICTVIGVAI
jgi:dynein light chain Tctex-type 1